MAYKHILLATDLTESSKLVGRRVKALADVTKATITILNVVEYTYVNLGGDLALPPQIDIESQLLNNATQQLAEFANDLGLSSSQQKVEHGIPKTVITDVAEELGVDLIAVGSHGRHGFARLLGSTANAVIHNAKCDVLAVRTATE